ncbi:hypothetical protein BAE44_0009780 [Dichanthelium oligosanthes]|uniref:RING-type domain-containing protein n=1 Tax=Dichanthelium oligosanthes TaxID=888268 RepID=A0A1E5VVP9_9POAL|nr:hypothetical protein BAE44_0009780 [Dichanthelium oligosanthes]
MATNADGNTYQKSNPYWYYQQPHRSGISWRYKVAGVVIAGLAVIALLARLLRFWLHSLKEAREADRVDSRHVRPWSSDGSSNSSSWDRAWMQPQPPSPAPAAVAMEMVRSVGPLVCTYRRTDGLREVVCLAELADGEAIYVLALCTHYFHADCISEWLRAHRTCPLYRAVA